MSMLLSNHMDVVVNVLHLWHLHCLLNRTHHESLRLLSSRHLTDPVNKLNIKHINQPLPGHGHRLLLDRHMGVVVHMPAWTL